jgi:hypothetical protein
METVVDPLLVAAFGSETRVRTLAALAGARRPMTAYRVAKVGGVPVQKAYEEFGRLCQSGLVAQREGGWVLVDNDVRLLLRKRVRVGWSEDRFSGETERERRADEVKARSTAWFDPSRYKPNPAVAARYAKEFARPPEKGPSRKTLLGP